MTSLFGIAIGLGIWSLIVWFFRIRDSNPKIDSSRVAYKIVCILWTTMFILGFILGMIGVFE
jgi:hypothetical protein